MPRAVIRRGPADFVLPLEKIACALIGLVMVPGARALFGVERRSA
jgi:chemotaxis response regulator CheB